MRSRMMVEPMDDDFGDIYADLDDHVNAGIATFDGVQKCGALEINRTGSMVERKDSSGNEEQSSESESDRVMSFNRAGDMVLEGEESEESSESEDDLRIVLNEDGRSKLPAPARRVDTGTRAEEQDEDVDEDLVTVNGLNCLNGDCKREEQVTAAGMAQGDRERKTSYNDWHVGSQSSGFVDKARSFSSARGDWDHFMKQCSRGSSYCKLGISMAAQSGINFSLPRNRTIFDISIEAFEQKPWRQHGMDITDYFNFGLNEESWKDYWQSMDHLRHEAATLTQCPCYESSGPQVVAREISSGTTQNSLGLSLTMENVEKGSKGLDMTKGRAIQVESGIGERLPTVDIRRPRYRDSDVVIRIPMEEYSANGSIPLGEVDHSDQREIKSLPPTNDSKLNQGKLHDDQDKQRRTVLYHYPDVAESSDDRTLDELRSKLDYSKGGKAFPKPDFFVQDAVSPADRENRNQSSLDYNTRSEASEDSDCSLKVHGFIRRASSSSAIGLQQPVKSDCHLSDDFRSSATETEEADGKHDNKVCSGNYRDWCKNKLKSKAKFKILSEGKEAPFDSHRQNDVHPVGVNCQMMDGKHGKKVDFVKDSTSNKETERPLSCKSRRNGETHTKEKHTNAFYSRGNYDSHHRRKLAEGNCPSERGVAPHDSEINHDNFHTYGRYHDNLGLRARAQQGYQEKMLRSNSLNKDRDSCYSHRNRRENQIRSGSEVIHDINATQRKHKDCHFQVVQGERIPYISEDSCGEFVRQAPVGGVVRHSEKRKRREKYYESLCKDKYMPNRFVEPGARISKHLDLLLDSNVYAPQTADESNCHRASSPVNISNISWKSSKHYEDHKRHFNSKWMQSKEYQYHSPENDDWSRHISCKSKTAFECHSYITVERNLYRGDICENIRSGRSSKPWRHTAVDSLRHHARVGLSSPDGAFLHERNCGHADSYVDEFFESNSKYPDAHLFTHGRKKIITGGTTSGSREDSRFVSKNFDKRTCDLGTLRRKEASIMHLNDVKRKFLKRSNEAAVKSRRNQDQYVNYANHIEDAPEVPSSLYMLGLRQQNPITLEVAIAESKLDNPDDHILSKLQDKRQGAQENEDNEIEEGQLIEEPNGRDVGLMRKNQDLQKQVTSPAIRASWSAGVKEKNTQSKHSAPNSKSIDQHDSNHLLETLAKMEKRKQRFKEPLAPKQGGDSVLDVQVDASPAIDEVKPQRPARKRRWVCS